MKPSRKLGIVVLLLLGSTGCAGSSARTRWNATPPEEVRPSRISRWFGSRWWSRPTPTSVSSEAQEPLPPQLEGARRNNPDVEIWPHQETASRLPRFFPLLGRQDTTDGSRSARITNHDLSSRTTVSTRPIKGADRDVQPAGAERVDMPPRPTRGQQTPPRTTLDQEDPSILPAPIDVNLPAGIHNRPIAEGDVALQVSPYDLPPDSVQLASRDEMPSIAPSQGPVGSMVPRREDKLLPVVGMTGDQPHGEAEPALDGGEQDRPAASRMPPPPIEDIQQSSPPPPFQEPGATRRPPSTRPSIPRQQPDSPKPEPAPPARTDDATPKPAGPVPRPAQTELAPEPTPAPATASPMTGPTTQSASMMPKPQGQARVPAPSPTAEARPAAKVITLASPQGGPACHGAPSTHPHKRWSLLTWIKSLHKPEPATQPYLPPIVFPTTYRSNVATATPQAAPKPSCQPCQSPVRPTPQAVLQPTAVPASTKTCFSWIGKGPVTGFFRKLKSLGKGCGCHCHHCASAAARPVPGPCGGGCFTGRCKSAATPTASPQTSATWSFGASPFSSLSPEPSNVSQGSQILERIAAQGLDKPAER